MSHKKDIWFVYDGECPICQMANSLYKVKKNVGKLHTVDARTDLQHPIMQDINLERLNLDEGMVIKYRNKLYQGQAALQIMATLGANEGFYNKTSNLLFRSNILSTLSYPLLRATRNLALVLLGKKKIENLKQDQDYFGRQP